MSGVSGTIYVAIVQYLQPRSETLEGAQILISKKFLV